MIVGCYTMHLYCDHPEHRPRKYERPGSLDAEYSGPTEGNCRKQARKDGWTFDLSKGTVVCVTCYRRHWAPA